MQSPSGYCEEGDEVKVLIILSAIFILVPTMLIGIACMYEDYTKWRKGQGW